MSANPLMPVRVVPAEPECVLEGPEELLIYAISMPNLKQIAEVYGADVATQISAAVFASMHRMFDDGSYDGFASPRSLDAFDLYVGRSWLGAILIDDSVDAAVHQWCLDASCQIHELDGQVLMVSVIAAKCDRQRNPAQTRQRLADLHHQLQAASQGLGITYALEAACRSDMRVAISWLEDAKANNLSLAWAPIRSLQDECSVAAYQARFCAMSPTGAAIDPESREIILRRLGFGTLLDIMTLARIASLPLAPQGPSIIVELAASTLLEAYWRVCLLLDEMPEAVRGRLLLQIQPVAASNSEELVAVMKGLASRGVGMGAELGQEKSFNRSLVLSMNPSFVSIPAVVMRSVAARPDNIPSVASIHALASIIAPDVFVRGIDTPLLAEIARRAGVQWGMGEHFGGLRWLGPNTRPRQRP